MFKPGTLVKCVYPNDRLTKDQIYEVVQSKTSYIDNNVVAIVNDEGFVDKFYNHRFKEVDNMTIQKSIFIDTINQELNTIVLNYLSKELKLITNEVLRKSFFRYLYITTDYRVEGVKTFDETAISINELFNLKIKRPLMVRNNLVEKTKDGIKIGCTELSMELVQEIYDFAKGNTQ